MQTLWQDLRYGARMLMKKPGFTLIAVITLALGIGANTAIFSVVNSVLLRPLPFRESERLTTFWLVPPNEAPRDMEWTEGLFAFLREHNRTYESLAAYDSEGFNLTGKDRAERLKGATVTHDFFRVLQQEPLLGRVFLPREDAPGNNNVIILSYQLWQQRFGGDPALIGQSLKLNNVPTVVVGVMPPGFDYPSPAEFWAPLGLNPSKLGTAWYLEQVGRLKPGVTLATAQQEMTALFHDFARQSGWPPSKATVLVKPLQQEITGKVQTPLLVLFGAVGLVLLIACANIANLLLARAAARHRELAVRCCLGASPRRIVAQLLSESLLLALLGAGGGLLLAVWGVDGLRHLAAEGIPRAEQIQLDSRALLFTLVTAVVSGLLFGLIPAWRAARVNLQDALKEGARGSGSVSQRRLNNAFVIAQLALSLVLLTGAALLLQSFRNLLRVDPGFRAEQVLTARIELPENQYAGESQVRNFYEQLVARVEVLPGVRAAGLCSMIPFGSSGEGNVFSIEGSNPGPTEPLPVAWVRDVSPDYFAAMGIPLLKGRPLQPSDTKTATPVAVIDEKLARAFWPNQDPIGKRLRWGRPAPGNPLMSVVGVVSSVKHWSLDDDAMYYVYMPVAQVIEPAMYIAIRTANDPEMMVAALRNQVTSLNPELPLFEVRTMEQAVASTLSARRLTNLLLAGFAATALLLAALGIYGVISLGVGARFNEFGIRLALGAQSSDVLKLVVKDGLKLIGSGVTFGLLASLALTRLMDSLLFGVRATDPVIFAAVSLLLACVALLACWIPARRATKVDPMIALRCE
ncbi:MAG: ABC transporter permease [Blastocatellia bacterium]